MSRLRRKRSRLSQKDRQKNNSDMKALANDLTQTHSEAMIREAIRTVIKNEITLSKLINDEEKKMTDSGATKDDNDNELYIDRNSVREIVKSLL